MSDPWLTVDSGPGESALNMAIDEALLLHVARLGRPVLRFYGWTEPAATFGYFQKYDDIARWTNLRPLIRRPSGGGLVPHLADWTYSLAFPPSHRWYALSAEESYHDVHDWLRAGFEILGIETSLAPEAIQDAPGQCFRGAEKHDLLWHGRKVAGRRPTPKPPRPAHPRLAPIPTARRRPSRLASRASPGRRAGHGVDRNRTRPSNRRPSQPARRRQIPAAGLQPEAVKGAQGPMPRNDDRTGPPREPLEATGCADLGAGANSW